MSKLTAYAKFIQQALKYGFSLFGTAPSGQITSYRTGDDGAYKKGYPRQGLRFVDNGDGTITDNATGLMWVKEPGALGGNFGSAGSPATMNWNNAIDECLGLTHAGHADWRLPNIKELLSIVDFSQENPSINSTFFPSTQSLAYWSSTTYIGFTGIKFYVVFDTITIGMGIDSGVFYPRPVRLGYPAD